MTAEWPKARCFKACSRLNRLDNYALIINSWRLTIGALNMEGLMTRGTSFSVWNSKTSMSRQLMIAKSAGTTSCAIATARPRTLYSTRFSSSPRSCLQDNTHPLTRLTGAWVGPEEDTRAGTEVFLGREGCVWRIQCLWLFQIVVASKYTQNTQKIYWIWFHYPHSIEEDWCDMNYNRAGSTMLISCNAWTMHFPEKLVL